MALDEICNHANVAPFISKQLIQRLITSNPSAGYIKRVAQVFNGNREGKRGDLSSVIQAILLDSEARTINHSANNDYSGKFREPMISLIQWVRTFSTGKSESGQWKIGTMKNEKTDWVKVHLIPLLCSISFVQHTPLRVETLQVKAQAHE